MAMREPRGPRGPRRERGTRSGSRSAAAATAEDAAAADCDSDSPVVAVGVMLTAAAPGVSSARAAAPAPVTAAVIAPTLVDEPEAAAAATSGLVPVPGNSGAAVLVDPSCRVNQPVEQRESREEDIQSFAERNSDKRTGCCLMQKLNV